MSDAPSEVTSALRNTLFDAANGGIACNALNAIAKSAASGDSHALHVLADYALRGPIGHMRTYATSRLASTIAAGNIAFATIFESLLNDPLTQYWAVSGLVKTNGPLAYPRITAIALDEQLPVEERANAIKQLALSSCQLFDRQLPSDPGHWSLSDLRLDELRAWATDGYPHGPGYSPPPRDPALDNPANDFERLVCRLDQKLIASRGKVDPANPHNFLIPAPRGADIPNSRPVESAFDLSGFPHKILSLARQHQTGTVLQPVLLVRGFRADREASRLFMRRRWQGI